MTAPVCPYCNTGTVLTTGTRLYPSRPDLADRHFWLCPTCPDVYVGCHGTGTAPLGLPANRETRRARQRAHRAFDALWKRKMRQDGTGRGKARHAGYAWLANGLGLAIDDTHISRFDTETCERVIAICSPYL